MFNHDELVAVPMTDDRGRWVMCPIEASDLDWGGSNLPHFTKRIPPAVPRSLSCLQELLIAAIEAGLELEAAKLAGQLSQPEVDQAVAAHHARNRWEEVTDEDILEIVAA